MDKSLSKTCATALGYGIGFILILVYGYMTGGFVFSSLWNWFVSPTLNLPKLTMIQAIGIAMVIGYFMNQANLNTEKESDNKGSARIIAALVYPWVVLFFGWAFHYMFF